MSNKNADELEVSVRMRLANKRKATEWFDIWMEVVEFGVHNACKESPGQKGLILERWRDRQPLYKQVRAEFEAMALDFREAFKTEGITHDDVKGWQMPNGKFTIRLVTRKERVAFSGDKAFIAFNFFQWWHAFKDAANPAAIPGNRPLIGA